MKIVKNTNKKYHFILIILILSLLFIFLNHINFLSNINQKLTDNLYGGKEPLDNIVIIGIDDKSLQALGKWPWDREIFANLVDKINNSKTIGFDLGFYEYSDNISDNILIEKLKKNKEKIVIACQYTSFEIDDKNNQIIGKNPLLPIKELKDNIICGYVNVIIDKDGISRAVNLNILGNYSSFTQSIYRTFTKSFYSYNENRYLINYVNGPNTFKTYSFSDVYSDNINKEEFENKIVLVGVTSPDFHDVLNIPIQGELMPGVEVHANILQTMFLNNNLNQTSNLNQNIIIIIYIILIALLFYFLKLIRAILLSLVLLVSYIFIVIFLFEKDILLNILLPIIAILISSIIYIIYYYLIEERKKTAIQDAFGKYVSPLLIEELINYPEKLTLGGEKREVTIPFSDIVGFTSISENMKPENLVLLLNEYLTSMTDIIQNNNGFVDKYIGDAIMCFWGAPIDNHNQYIDASKTAIEMQEKLKDLNKIWKKKYGVKLEVRIGLNTDYCVVGNMGSKHRFDYTIMGDGVNLASRLESINKFYGTNIIISESLNKHIIQIFRTKQIDTVKVKGKKQGIKLFEIIDYKDKVSKKKEQEIQEFEKALKFYQNQEFEKAKKLFMQLNDKISKIYLNRIEEFQKNPSKNWDYIHTMNTK